MKRAKWQRAMRERGRKRERESTKEMGMEQRYVYKIYLFWFSLCAMLFFSHVSFSLCVCAFPVLLNSFFHSTFLRANRCIYFCHRREWHRRGAEWRGGGRRHRWFSDGSTVATIATTATSLRFHIHIARISATYESASFLQFMVKKCKFNFLQCVVILISLPLSELPMPL